MQSSLLVSTAQIFRAPICGSILLLFSIIFPVTYIFYSNEMWQIYIKKYLLIGIILEQKFAFFNQIFFEKNS